MYIHLDNIPCQVLHRTGGGSSESSRFFFLGGGGERGGMKTKRYPNQYKHINLALSKPPHPNSIPTLTYPKPHHKR